MNPDFKQALAFAFELNANGLSRRCTHEGAYDCFKYHGETIRTALLIADALMQDPTSMMEIEGTRAHDEVNRGCFYTQQFDAEKVFKAMRTELLKGIL